MTGAQAEAIIKRALDGTFRRVSMKANGECYYWTETGGRGAQYNLNVVDIGPGQVVVDIFGQKIPMGSVTAFYCQTLLDAMPAACSCEKLRSMRGASRQTIWSGISSARSLLARYDITLHGTARGWYFKEGGAE